MSGDRYLTATVAKKEYFLNTDDLRPLSHQRLPGWGSGQYKLYSRTDPELAARAKHGVDGLADKRAKRARREENKRRREQEAREAERQLLVGDGDRGVVDLTGENNDLNTTHSTAAAALPSADPKQVATLQKEIRRALKPNVSWDFLRAKRSEHGAEATVRLLRVSQAEYVALIGRPTDPDLRSVVKRGAWYTSRVPYKTLFGPKLGMTALTGSGGRYNCNSDLGVNPESSLVVKYSPSNSTLSVTAFVQHCDTFGYDMY